jgi:hypothetical protein
MPQRAEDLFKRLYELSVLFVIMIWSLEYVKNAQLNIFRAHSGVRGKVTHSGMEVNSGFPLTL